MTDKRGLPKTLDQLVRRAAAHPGLPVRQPLGKGLRVDVLIRDGETYLQISRDNVWPSSREWTTVTRDFPTLIPPTVAPTRSYAEGRYYLTAHWTTNAIEQVELI